MAYRHVLDTSNINGNSSGASSSGSSKNINPNSDNSNGSSNQKNSNSPGNSGSGNKDDSGDSSDGDSDDDNNDNKFPSFKPGSPPCEVVNDNDGRLQYTGTWVLESKDPNGIYFTTHTTSSIGSEVSISFNGELRAHPR